MINSYRYTKHRHHVVRTKVGAHSTRGESTQGLRKRRVERDRADDDAEER